MIAAILATVSILGARPLSTDDPGRQALVVQNAGRVVLRLASTGAVQARGCDGQMHYIGALPGQPVRIHLENDGTLTGLAWDQGLTAEQRQVFRQMVRAWGMSDHRALAEVCLPTTLSGAGSIQTIMDSAPEPAFATGPFAP